MKTMILVALATLCSIGSFARQHIFEDAVRLRKILGSNTKFDSAQLKLAIPILKLHLDAGETVANFSKNPFFDDFLTPGTAAAITNDTWHSGFTETATEAHVGTLDKAYTPVGGMDVTTVADGIARFLIKRAKEELNVAFFDRFRQQMNGENFRDAVTLFPETCRMLLDIGDNIYMYQAYLPAMQEAFQHDLRVLTDNLPKVINDGHYTDFFTRHPLLKYTCLSGTYITGGILDEVHPGKIIEDFPAEYFDRLAAETYSGYDSNAIKDMAAALRTFQLISTSFKVQDSEKYWASAKEVRDAFSDPLTFKLYMALLHKQAKHIKFAHIHGQDRSLTVIFEKLAANYGTYHKPYAAFCTALIAQGESVHNDILGVADLIKNRETPPFELYYKYFNGVIDLFDQAGRFTELPIVKDHIPARFDSTFNGYVRVCRRTASLALNIKQRNYSTAVIDAYSIYTFAFSKQVIEEEVKRDKDDLRQLSETEKKKLQLTQRFAHVLLRVGTFVASVAEAKSSEDVSNAIEAAALPAGSSRIKRESAWNVALNAYIGPFVAYEHIDGIDNKVKVNSYGLLAPIGIAVSRGLLPLPCKRNKSLSLFVSVVDLGAVAAFRFENSQTAEIPTITLRELVSPGAFLSYGFGRVPISLAAGVQMGPRLRNIEADENNVVADVSEVYTRYSLSLTVDIPLLNFATWQPKR